MRAPLVSPDDLRHEELYVPVFRRVGALLERVEESLGVVVHAVADSAEGLDVERAGVREGAGEGRIACSGITGVGSCVIRVDAGRTRRASPPSSCVVTPGPERAAQPDASGSDARRHSADGAVR